MLIIKPYGFSKTTEPRARRLKKPATLEELQSLSKIPQFIMSQWVSVIDKIITKPKGKNPPTDDPQKQLRTLLGEAAWKYLQAEPSHPLGDITKALWERRIHPYASTKPTSKVQHETQKNHIKGRWYADFVDIEPDKLDKTKADEVVKKIDAHLNQQALRKGASRKPKRQGHITAQLDSIAKNVLHLRDFQPPLWKDGDWDAYFKAGDVVAQIANEAKPTVKTRAKSAKAKSAQVGKTLYTHYAKVFQHDGKILSANTFLKKSTPSSPAEASHPQQGQFALHCAIKACYKALLDGKMPKLPEDKAALKILLKQRHGNQELANVIRLGKVIHYQALFSHNEGVTQRWPSEQEVAESAYWLSDGQAEIKRNEALVRIWKLVIAHAAHSLSDWAQWGEGDILLAKFCDTCHGIKPVDSKQADPSCKDQCTKLNLTAFDAKLERLYGRKAEHLVPTLKTDEKSRAELLKFATKAWASLRHSSFHFKGLQSFLKALATDDTHNLPQGLNHLWRDDQQSFHERLQKSLEAAHCLDYLQQQQLQSVYSAIAQAKPKAIPMPRLNRVLTRVKNAPMVDNLPLLPAPAKSKSLEKSPALLCQYTLLKLLYERVFPAWLEKKGHKEISKWIDKASKRADKVAQEINNDETAQARTNALKHFADNQGMSAIQAFFDQLDAHMAREDRVQRGYEANAQKAAEQSAYIERLKCDVVAQALRAYLNQEWLWLFDLNEAPNQAIPSCLAELPNGEASKEFSPWQARLYFLLHLVPVSEVSSLLHQLRKWEVLEKKSQHEEHNTTTSPDTQNTGDTVRKAMQAVQEVMTLYLDMHSAKFDGGSILDDSDMSELENCFEEKNDFKALYGDAEHRLPRRGLRELLRFGHIDVLLPVFKQFPIKRDELERLNGMEDGGVSSQVAQAQDDLQKLHQCWVQEKKNFSAQKEYTTALKTVEQHRHLAARVRLTHHLRLHHLLMSVLARLVDYAGLWERDLYFEFLGKCYRHGGIDNIIKQKNQKQQREIKKLIKEGKVADVLKEPSQDWEIVNILSEQRVTNDLITIRDNLSHFNMLQTGNLNLSNWVNQTRQLMSYDRKLKNAVSKSIIELLACEGLVLGWEMEGHKLSKAKVTSELIEHLGGKVKEEQHSKDYCGMVASLFVIEHSPSSGQSGGGDKNSQLTNAHRHPRKPATGYGHAKEAASNSALAMAWASAKKIKNERAG